MQFLQPVQIAEEADPKHPRVAGMRKATQSIGAQFERRARLASATQSGFQVAQRLFRHVAEEFESQVDLLRPHPPRGARDEAGCQLVLELCEPGPHRLRQINRDKCADHSF